MINANKNLLGQDSYFKPISIKNQSSAIRTLSKNYRQKAGSFFLYHTYEKISNAEMNISKVIFN